MLASSSVFCTRSMWLDCSRTCLLEAVWSILNDGEFDSVLANAAHVKNVPGRKTDVIDAMWLAELLAHGLIRARFVPDTQTQEMRSAEGPPGRQEATNFGRDLAIGYKA